MAPGAQPNNNCADKSVALFCPHTSTRKSVHTQITLSVVQFPLSFPHCRHVVPSNETWAERFALLQDTQERKYTHTHTLCACMQRETQKVTTWKIGQVVLTHACTTSNMKCISCKNLQLAVKLRLPLSCTNTHKHTHTSQWTTANDHDAIYNMSLDVLKLRNGHAFNPLTFKN